MRSLKRWVFIALCALSLYACARQLIVRDVPEEPSVPVARRAVPGEIGTIPPDSVAFERAARGEQPPRGLVPVLSFADQPAARAVSAPQPRCAFWRARYIAFHFEDSAG